MKKMLALCAGMLMVMLVAVACSDDDSGDSALSSAIADAILAEPSEGDFETTEDQARCYADSVIDTLGEDRLAELGITAEAAEGIEDFEDAGITDEEAQTFSDAAFECIDVEDVLVAMLVDFGSGISEEDAKCIAGTADSDFYSQFRAGFHPRGQSGEAEQVDIWVIAYEGASECLDGGGPAVDMLMEAGFGEEHAKCVVENLDYVHFVWMVTSLHPGENSPEFTEAYDDMRSECDQFN